MKRITLYYFLTLAALGFFIHAQAAETVITALSDADVFTTWVLGMEWAVEAAPTLEICGTDGLGAQRTTGKIPDMLPIPYTDEVWQLELEVIGDQTARLMVRGEHGPILAAYRFEFPDIPAPLKSMIAAERAYPGASVNRMWEYSVENETLIFRGTGPKNQRDVLSFPNRFSQLTRSTVTVTTDPAPSRMQHVETAFRLSDSPTYCWTRECGSTNSDYGVSVISEGGVVYMTGQASGAIDGQSFLGVSDFFLRKYDSEGISLWTRMWGTTSGDEADGICKYGTNIYISGNARASVAGQPYVGSRDFCLTKYSDSGTRLWVRMRGTSGNDYGRGVAVDSAGNVYFAGLVGGALDGQTYAGSSDPCLIKYDADGNWLWTRLWGSAGSEKVFGITIDEANHIYVAGTTAGSFGGQTNAGNGDLFVSKFDTDGNRAWDRIFGTTGEQFVSSDDRGNNVSASRSGFVSVVGSSGPVGGLKDAYLRSYSDAGDVQWTSIWGSTNTEYCTAVCMDTAGDLVVAGTTYGPFDGQSYSGSQGELFLSRFSSDGTRPWSRIWGSSVGDFGFGVCISTAGEIFVTGAAGGSVDGQAHAGGNDVFVTLFSESVDQPVANVLSIAPKPGKEFVVAGTTWTKEDFNIVVDPPSGLALVSVSPLSYPTAGVYRVVASSGSSAATTTVMALQSDSILNEDNPEDLLNIPMSNGVPVYTTTLSRVTFEQLVMIAHALGSPLDQLYDGDWSDWGNAIEAAQEAKRRGMLDTIQGIEWADIKAIIADPVHVVQGNFYVHETDLQLAAPEPLEIHRSYSSDNLASSDLATGWRLSRNYFLFVNNPVFDLATNTTLPANAEVRVSEPDGTVMVYSRSASTPANVLLPNANSTASEPNTSLNNLNGNGIGARANLLNNRVEYVPSNRSFYVWNGQGAVRRFDWQAFGATNDPAYRKRPYLEYERTPTGNRISYTYTSDGLPSTIRATDGTGTTIFNSATYQYNAAGKLWRITASDGRMVSYYYDDFGDLARVVRPDGSEVLYGYEHFPIAGISTNYSSHRIIRVQHPDNRILENEYFQTGETVGGEVLANGHYLIGRVKLQKVTQTSPTALVTNAWFNYSVVTNAGDPEAGSGFTEVFDALRNKTVYRFDSSRRITAIERYAKVRDPNGDPIMDGTNYTYTRFSTERRYWNSANLVRTALENPSSNIVFNWGATYDDRGNLLSEKITGNLSGNFSDALQFDTNGLPLNGESSATLYSYTYSTNNNADAQNLMTSIIRPNGSVSRFVYASPSNSSLAARYFCLPDGDSNALNNAIYSREFYEYDNNQVLTRRITDDGTASNKTDLTSVTQRRINESTPGTDMPLFGLPLTVYDKFYNGAAEQTLLRHDLHYDARGNATNAVTYDSTNGLQFSTSFGYDLMNRQTFAVDAHGGLTSYTYDDNGNLIAADGPLTNLTDTTTYTYDYANRLTASIRRDGYGNVLTNTLAYDGYGNETAQTNPYGQVTRSYYDDLHHRTRLVLPPITTAEGDSITPILLSTFDLFDNLIAQTDANSNTTTYTSNARKQRTVADYPDNTRETFTYDTAGRLVKSCAPNNACTVYQHDGLDRITNRSVFSETGTLLARYTTAYNAFNVSAETDANTNTTSFVYDGAGRLTVEYGPGAPATRSQTQYLYNDLSRIIERRVWFGTNAADYSATVYTYDNLNRVLSEMVQDSAATTLLKTEYGYDAAGNRTLIRTFPASASSGAVTLREYDALNKPVSITDALSNRTTYAYDYSGVGLKTTITDPLTNKTILILDALGRETGIERRDATNGLLRLTEYRHDPNGNRTRDIETVLGSNHVITTGWTYDTRNRAATMTEALGSADERTTRYFYNDAGQLYSQKNPNGVEWFHFYDAYGRVQNLVSADNTIRYHYAYDANGNRISVQDIVTGQTTTREMDEYNRLKKETQATGFVLEYAYDRAGRETRVLLPGSNAVDYVYNAAFMTAVRRMTNVASLSASGTLAYQHVYTSNDLAGNLLGVTLASSQPQTFQNDPLNRRMLISGPAWTQTVATGTSGYDPVGNVKNFTVNDPGATLNLTHTYDGLYQLASEAGIVSRTYAHDSIGNRLSINSGTTAYTYNSINELLLQKASSNVLTGTICLPVSGLYGPTKLSEAVSSITVRLDSGSVLPATLTNGTWEYVSAGRKGLSIPVDGANHTITATATTTNGITNTKTTTVNVASTTLTDYQWDRNGNLIRKTLHASNAVVWTYAYDALNRLVSATKAHPTTAVYRIQYAYDPFNRLLSKTISTDAATTSVQRFLWDGPKEIGSANASNQLLQLRILGQGLGNEIGAAVGIELRTNSAVAWNVYVPIHDHRGNVVALLNSTTGAVAEYTRYTAFGEAQPVGGPTGNPWPFSSKRSEAETGLIYFGHRFYDPTLGRFITADPLGFADGPNRYLYAQANPLTQTDPDGLLARQIGLKAADWADANFSLVNDDWRYMPTMNELEWSDWGDYVPAAVQNLLIAPIWNLAAGTLNPMIDVNIYGADSEYAVYLFISLHPEVAMQLEYTVQTVGPLLESSLGRMSQWISGNKSQSVAAPKTRVGYHATYPEAAQGIRQTGFRPGTKPGRLGAGGTYVNNTAEGAIFEFTHHNPGVTPEVLKVRYNPGVEAVTDIAPVNYVERLPLNVDSISAPSVRLPGTQNTITYNPLEVLP